MFAVRELRTLVSGAKVRKINDICKFFRAFFAKNCKLSVNNGQQQANNARDFII
jgi:hypothetical protein